MKKVLVSALMAIALIASGTAYAQTQSDATTGATKQSECCQTAKGEKSGKDFKKGGKQGKGIKGSQATRPQFNPFDGVQLTDDQQQRLQVLQQGLGPVVLDKEQQAKIKENPNLTPEQKKQLKEERKARKLEAKKNYLNGVKEILTPEQYVIFLENVYLYSPQKDGKAKGFKSGKGKMKAGKDGARGQKGQKPSVEKPKAK